MKASIVISTKDKLSRLKLVLHALESQVNDEIEVIIVFDGCNEKMIDQYHQINFSFSPVNIICETNVGRAAARNLGINKTKGEIIIFLDDDRVPCSDFVQMHIDGHSQKCILYGDRQDVFFTENEIEQLPYVDNIDQMMNSIQSRIVENNAEPTTSPIDPANLFKWLNFLTGNISVEKKYLVKAGLFDEHFKEWGQEDIDLGIRLYKEKLPYKRDGRIVNYHLLHDSNFNIKEMRKKSLKNLRYMIKKYKNNFALLAPLVWLYMRYKVLGLSITHDAQTYEKRFVKN
ncbi:glycosyltransferase [Chengkuizengella marina]|uniref:Glycosyltransferase n=1 Tax=Chengkuizengella marina TaxID=2507566 RepID=A0A6N9PYY9_9BACL|nr:glycosyltransferase [Chengkuizengella marina]NBI28187.1 glycosyltransferase [Chengkuizengella marina]